MTSELTAVLEEMWLKHARLACLTLDRVTAAMEQLDGDALTVGDVVKLAGLVNDLERVPGGSAFKPGLASSVGEDMEDVEDMEANVVCAAGPVRFYMPVNGREVAEDGFEFETADNGPYRGT